MSLRSDDYLHNIRNILFQFVSKSKHNYYNLLLMNKK